MSYPKQIIYFGNDWSAENRTSSHHIAAHLSRNHKVLYVECPGLRAPKTNKRDLLKIFKKLSKVFKKPKIISQNLMIFTLIQIPFHKIKLVSKLNYYLSIFLLKRVCSNNNITNPILWFVVPHVGYIVGTLNEQLAVYYCIDDYSALPDVDSDVIKDMDLTLSNNVDVVFTASSSLALAKKNQNKNVLYSPHGVEYEHFHQAFGKNIPLPEDIRLLQQPIIGFFGLLEAWIDLDLICDIARRYPNYNIVIIGRVAVDVSQFNQFNNIHLLGKKDFSDLPAYACGFDVCILPYKHNDQIYSCNPIKLKEYLATGNPVVSVSFPEIMEYQDVVFISKDSEEFVENIGIAISTDSSELRIKRAQRVSNLTWSNRVIEIEKSVETFL